MAPDPQVLPPSSSMENLRSTAAEICRTDNVSLALILKSIYLFTYHQTKELSLSEHIVFFYDI